ncbi:MAG: CRISPR-associated protein [Prevotella sp.]|nr:CRISPR-associated protein [Prevotella sp.]
MFINLTNHPSSGWSQEQREAARQYGEIVDISFPIIEPYFTKAEVEELADITVETIKNLDANPVVHVMGEMTFTYAIVVRLKSQGITCVASTTERLVKILPDGKKVSEFKFVQFREY